MKALIASHTHNIYLKPGEIFVSRKPVLISTVLGSCVAVTLFSASSRFGAICHAMMPENAGRENDVRYVDTALRHLYQCIVKHGVGNDLVVKMFGGAQVLDVGDSSSTKLTIGEQNVAKAEEVLGSLGLAITARDTGGMHGRKLFFCTRSGDVYLRRMRSRQSLNKDTTI
ncbi:MAG: chemotaxis protein CheD [Deltaproteobacteria bacterium]|nr:chemotaxis protein CheD [Deltaproteobacteria bacterium]